MKKQLFVALLLIASAAIWTGCNKEDKQNGAITGVVTDFATGEPVRSVNVQLRPSEEVTLTDIDGIYEFKNLPEGKYSIIVSKFGYIANKCAIEIKKGKPMTLDIRIEKKPQYIRITDMDGNDLDSLDFGSESSVTMKSFHVYNNCSADINYKIVYSCDWITSVSSLTKTIAPGANAMVSVGIDRLRLVTGVNMTELQVLSNNDNVAVTIKAKR